MSGWRGYLIAFTLCYLHFFNLDFLQTMGEHFWVKGISDLAQYVVYVTCIHFTLDFLQTSSHEW